MFQIVGSVLAAATIVATLAAAPVYGEGGSKYRTAYYSFPEGFTSNLSDSAGLVQVELAVSTRRDGQTIYYSLASTEVQAVLETLYRVYCAPDC